MDVESIDETSLASTVSTEVNHEVQDEEHPNHQFGVGKGPASEPTYLKLSPIAGGSKIDSPGLSSPSDPPHFAETKSVSDDYAAAGDTDTNPRTPSPKTDKKDRSDTNGSGARVFSRGVTPGSVPKYKIALTSNLLARATGSPVQKAGTATG